FHLRVSEAVDATLSPILVEEVKVLMSDTMKDIQSALLDCIEMCLNEIRRSNPTIDLDELTVENALHKSFDTIIRGQLDPIWHRVSSKSKGLVADLKTLRCLLGYLVVYDCVTFNSFLETILSEHAAVANSSTSVFQTEFTSNQWLSLDAAHTVFLIAKQRVYIKQTSQISGNDEFRNSKIPLDIIPILEEQPKWRALIDTLCEIDREKIAIQGAGGDCGSILIMAEGDRTCLQIRQILDNVDFTTVKSEVNEDVMFLKESDNSKRRHQHSGSVVIKRQKINQTIVKSVEKGKRFTTDGSQKLLSRLLENFFSWKGRLSKVAHSLNKRTTVRPNGSNGSNIGSRIVTNQGRDGQRRRTRGSSVMTQSLIGASVEPSIDDEAAELDSFLNSVDENITTVDTEEEELIDPTCYGIISSDATIVVRPYATSSATTLTYDGDEDERVLEELNPQWIIMYNPSLSFVRRTEMWHMKNSKVNRIVRLYFLVYDGSVEEQVYLSGIRKEKAAFEKLIHEKANMAIPIDADSSSAIDPDDAFWSNLDTRLAGGSCLPSSTTNHVITDVREFRSSLPSHIHIHKLKIHPCTLEVGDYILTPELCVERKSISDLISSLKSGRLYNQCEAMARHYTFPVVLIEVDGFKGLGGLDGIGVEGGLDSLGRLVLLLLSCKKVGLIWGVGVDAASEIFVDLKREMEEPDMNIAMSKGIDSADAIDSDYNVIPQDMLRSIPGITSKNYWNVMRRFPTLRALAESTQDELQDVIGELNACKVHEFFKMDIRDVQP
ncbi:hypothetical protein HK096_004872, partial [Nowakowskiella sp. JEL0078]